MDNVHYLPNNQSDHTKFLGRKPKGTFPKGTIPVSRNRHNGEISPSGVVVNLAVGMYQFHDLIASHVYPDEFVAIKDFGFINY